MDGNFLVGRRSDAADPILAAIDNFGRLTAWLRALLRAVLLIMLAATPNQMQSRAAR